MDIKNIGKLFPFLKWAKGYNKKTLSADFIAGLTVAVILIPQVMAYAIIAGMPPVYGLYAALFGTAVAAMWGSSAQLSTGPSALVSFLIMTALSQFADPGSTEFIGLAVVLALLVGAVQFFMGVFRLGFLVNFISHAVIVGFASAAAIIIASTQVPNLFGFSIGRHEHVYQSFLDIFKNISDIHILTAFIGIVSVVVIYTLKKISPKIPSALIAMTVGTVATWYFGLDQMGVKIIGDISSNIPTPSVPSFNSDILTLIPTALVISIVSFLEGYAIAKSISQATKQKIDVNQELIGQGLGNITSSLFKGFPISGSFSRSAVNFAAGAVTGVSSVFVSIFVLITLLFFTPYLYYLPKAILAAIVIVAVMALVDIAKMKEIYRISKVDGALVFIVFATSFILKPDDAIFIGVILSMVLFIKTTMTPRVVELGYEELEGRLRGIGKHHTHQSYPDLLMVRMDMSIFFANADMVMNKLRKMVAKKPEATNILLSFAGVNYIDVTGIEALEEFLQELEHTGKKVHFIYTKKQVRDVLERVDHLHHTHHLINIDDAKKLFK